MHNFFSVKHNFEWQLYEHVCIGGKIKKAGHNSSTQKLNLPTLLCKAACITRWKTDCSTCFEELNCKFLMTDASKNIPCKFTESAESAHILGPHYHTHVHPVLHPSAGCRQSFLWFQRLCLCCGYVLGEWNQAVFRRHHWELEQWDDLTVFVCELLNGKSVK